MPTPDQVNQIMVIVSAQTVLRIRQIMATLIPPAAITEAEYIGQVEPLLNHIRMDTFNYYTATVWPDVQQNVFTPTVNVCFRRVQYSVRRMFVNKVLTQLVPTMREEWRAENIVAVGVEGPAFVGGFRQFSLRKNW